MSLDADRSTSAEAEATSSRVLPEIDPALAPPRAGPGKRLLRLLVLLLSAGLFVRVLWMADLRNVAGLLAEVGPLALLAVVPYGVAVTLDTAGWAAILRGLEARVATWRLLGLRLSTEAVHLSFPGGPILAEGLKVWFLSRRFGVPAPEGSASLAVKKALQLGTQGVYLFVAAAVGGSVLPERSVLRPVLFGLAALTTLISVGMIAVLLSGRVAERLFRLLRRVPLARVQSWMIAREVAFMDTDQHVRGVLQSHVRGLMVAFLWILGGWFAEAGETWVLLRLLGIDLSFSMVLAFEPVVSFARSAAFFIPAGLGVQDAGYMAFLRQAGIPDAVNRAAAFVLLKRFKELVWIALGWILLLATRARTGAPGLTAGSAAKAERASS
ncbi:MAG TPA: lysylphosphatidylglycerol synthase domain-containing protein [Myxococcaceae bacterium]|nr:lysylphosphatidylglycerol synthase domain-containing protein [Myxococcaceae bacterium]